MPDLLPMEPHVLDPAAKVSRLMRLVPEAIPAHAFTRMVNHALRGQAIAGRLAELDGKRVRLCANDVPLAVTFEIRGRALARSDLEPHVTMRGSLRDFAELALRREDPDT